MREELEIIEQRDYKIAKANEVIRKARNQLGLVQLKALAYILSKVKPTDKSGLFYNFDISDFCKVCEIDYNGKNYNDVKAALKSLRDKSFWIIDDNGNEVLCSWIEKPIINPRSRRIKVRLDEDIQKYVIALISDYTQYSLWEVVPMKSRYSFVLFELLKSYAFQKKPSYTFELDELKKQIGATKYNNFKDFRINVLELATREINQFTTINIQWEPIKKGRKVVQIVFYIRLKNEKDLFTAQESENQLEGQKNIYDYMDSDRNIIIT